MPISSGATGRVDIGVDTSIAWTPEGLRKDGKPITRSCDSYLRRYLETQGLGKNVSSRNTAGDANERHGGEEGGPTEVDTQQTGGSEGDGSGAGGHSSRKSKTCTLL